MRAFADDVAAVGHAAEAAWSETGARDLAVGFPFVEGRTTDGTWIRAPLLLYPVTLRTTSSGRLAWVLEPLGPPELNESLVQALVRMSSVRLSLDDLLSHDEDKLLRCDAPTWASFVRYLRSVGFPIADDETLPALAPLPPRPREERESAPLGKLALVPHLVLGRFPRADSTVVTDYDELLASETLDDARLGIAAQLLAVDEAAPDVSLPNVPLAHDPDFSRARTWQVFPSDDSQDEALRASGRGAVVVQGPPGTGKSQMIANLIASAIGEQKRVLVVCQKRAALDVVADRLSSVGLREPVAVVYDVARDRAEVCDAIVRSLESEATNTQRDMEERGREHARAQSRLSSRLDAAQTAFAALGGDKGVPGLAELAERTLDDDGRALPDLSAFAAGVTDDEVQGALPRIELLSRQTVALAAPHPLARRGDWRDHGPAELANVFALVRELRDVARHLDAAPKGQLTPGVAAGLNALWKTTAVLLDPIEKNDLEPLRTFLLGWVWTGGHLEHGEWARAMSLLITARKKLTEVPQELVLAERKVLDAWLVDLAELGRIETRWYRFLVPSWWSLRKRPQAILDRCTSSALVLSTPTTESTRALCAAARPWQDLIEALPSDSALFEFGLRGELSELDDAITTLDAQHSRTRAVHVLAAGLASFGGAYARLPELDAHAASTLSADPFLGAAVRDRARARILGELERATDRLRGELDAALLDELVSLARAGDTKTARETIEALAETEPSAAEAARLDDSARDLGPWARAMLRTWRPGSLVGVGEDAITAMSRAWMKVVRGERSATSIETALVDGELLGKLSEDVDTCLASAGRGVLASYRLRVSTALADRTRGVALRTLGTEVAKKRNRATMRQLVERYWDQGLSELRPVWFCSPESVAALFPLRSDLFDLVVLDEASQCPVEAALPALTRARHALVAGDDQQMPPAHFFRASNDDDEEDDELTILATNSVLGLARVAFPGTILRWHYRSRHEELIAFSNAAFYGGRLVTAPRAERKAGLEGLRWLRVPGLWQGQTNAVEAERVVELVAEALAASHHPTIGVIAFNKKQADLILERLDNRELTDPTFRALRERDRKRNVVEQLFVRNLENVQGDERDLVIVSLGYGPSEPGGRVRAAFGPIGQEGGEKRLNVAVTRARSGLAVVSSIEPHELDTSGSKNVGPKLLAAYLGLVRARSMGDLADAERHLDLARQLGGGHGVTGGSIAPIDRRAGKRVARDLADALETSGLRVERQFGLGHRRLDLVVGRPDESSWRIGVDCTEFLADSDALSRDVYGPRFWKRMGWTVIRVSPLAWLDDARGVTARIAEQVTSGR